MRAIFHACVSKSLEAVDFYSKAFGADIQCCYVDASGKFVEHAELSLNGRAFLSVMEAPEAQPGNTMCFFLLTKSNHRLKRTMF